MEITGKIIKVLPLKKGISKNSGKEWMNQDFVVEIPNEENPQYPQKVVINIFGEDKINEANLVEGKEVKVLFNFNAKEWKGSWFNSISAWKVYDLSQDGDNAQAAREADVAKRAEEFKAKVSEPVKQQDDDTDLPF